MASSLKNLSSYDEKSMPSAKGLKFGIVVADYHAKITHALYEGCVETLLQHGAEEADIHTIQVPGAFELTAGARLIGGGRQVDAVICLGCVIKGETSHNEYINQAVATGLTNLSIATGRPYIFGLLTPNDEQQAFDRAGGKHGNKGIEAAQTAIRMAAIKQEMESPKQKIGFS
jgi:6,7-dimethyl-8-ribityllumazine synthase